MYHNYMMFTITICCFFANIICGIATVRYGLKSNGMPGVLCVLLTLTVSVVWTFAEIFFLPSENNWLGQIKFFAWTLLPFLPWIFLWRKKYKILSPELFRIGLSGFLTQAVFFTEITCLAVGGNWQESLEYDIPRYCGAILLLFAVPALLLNSLAFWIKKESWKCPNVTLALIAGLSAFFFFLVGLGSLRISV